ncbi:DUF2905 domain-containing protein [Halanaerobaculum tunisiense]
MKLPNLIIWLGIILISGGLAWKAGLPIGNLPGDIHITGDNFSFYLPITTSILASIIISLLLRLIQ